MSESPKRLSKLPWFLILIPTIPFAVVAGYFTYQSFRPKSADEIEIRSIFEDLRAAASSGEFEDAYRQMSPSYREQHSLTDFAQELTDMRTVSDESFSATEEGQAATLGPGSWGGGDVLGFRKIEGRWYCDGITGQSYD